MVFFPDKSALQPEGLLHTRGIAGSGLPPLSKIPHCCLPQESGPCLSPSVAGRPLRPATDRRLGGPLPHQLANPPQTPPIAPSPFTEQGFFCTQRYRTYAVLASLSRCYSPLRGRSSTCYSPVRHYLSVDRPFDLHVLSTPPAFVLSQDQTLQTKISGYLPRRSPKSAWMFR